MKIYDQNSLYQIIGLFFFIMLGLMPLFLFTRKMLILFEYHNLWFGIIPLVFMFLGWAQFHSNYCIVLNDGIEIYNALFFTYSKSFFSINDIKDIQFEEKLIHNRPYAKIVFRSKSGVEYVIREFDHIKKQRILLGQIKSKYEYINKLVMSVK